MSTKTKVNKNSLKYKIENEKVRYSLACGRLSIQPKGSQVVKIGDRYERMELPGISLECEGEKRMDGVTREFDPSIPRDREIIEIVDKYIEEHPEVINLNTVQLRKLTGGSLAAPPGIARWDEMDADQIYSAAKATELDPEVGMKYEMDRENRSNPKTSIYDMEPREDVLNMLEKIYVERKENEQDAFDSTVKL